MQDLTDFLISRPTRRVEPTEDECLLLRGSLSGPIAEMLAHEAKLEDPAIEEQLSTFSDGHSNPLTPVASPDTPQQWVIALMVGIEIWLARQEDLASGVELQKQLDQAASTFAQSITSVTWTDALAQYAADVADWIVVWLFQTPKPHGDLAWATRYALVASLAQRARADLNVLTAQRVWTTLNRRTVTLPKALMRLFAQARIQLIREASVSDLHVIRSEWRGYLPGEIAMIRNVMAGETYQEQEKHLAETETTTQSETETTATQQRQDESQSETDMSRDLQTQIEVGVRGQVQTQYEQSAPGNRFSVSAGMDASVQLGRTERVASRIARQAVSKAISTLESRTRQSRIQRELIRTEETRDHGFSAGDEHRRGIYRWVDRVDRFQVFTYPDRLQLEFELPEPAEYVRWRTKAKVDASTAEAPPAWAVSASELTPEGALQLAAKYRASNLPVLPDEHVSLVQSKTAAPKDLPEHPDQEQWRVPSATIEVEVPVPDGYAAYEVDYAGYATPLHGTWRREYAGAAKDGGAPAEGFHVIMANVFVGTSNAGFFQTENSNWATANSLQGHRGDDQQTQYGGAMLNIVDPSGAAMSVPIAPAATGKLALSAQAAGCESLGITFTVKCARTQETLETWQHAVYDALFSAWNDWNRNWQNAQSRRALASELPVGESSPSRNLQTVKDELKRQVIAWLLDENPFNGREALLGAANTLDWRETDFERARSCAPTIQFMEQAFEWGNMTYVFYPYYWAGRPRWDQLSNLEGVDPEFERFLKAGSVRVVVPVRPGMEAALHHWLLYLEPFLGRPMPLPSDSMFVSVATEIHDLTQPPEGGIAGESWDARLGTTMVWLDTSENLPKNSTAKLGQAPHEPKDPIPLP
jgi:hypothetical protein